MKHRHLKLTTVDWGGREGGRKLIKSGCEEKLLVLVSYLFSWAIGKMGFDYARLCYKMTPAHLAPAQEV